MIGRVFLGKPLHWALIAAVIAIGWVLGERHVHVSQFNLFVIILLAVSACVVIAVILTCKPGERVTRDPLEGEE